jgi:hypothetical protein
MMPVDDGGPRLLSRAAELKVLADLAVQPFVGLAGRHVAR